MSVSWRADISCDGSHHQFAYACQNPIISCPLQIFLGCVNSKEIILGVFSSSDLWLKLYFIISVINRIKTCSCKLLKMNLYLLRIIIRPLSFSPPVCYEFLSVELFILNLFFLLLLFLAAERFEILFCSCTVGGWVWQVSWFPKTWGIRGCNCYCMSEAHSDVPPAPWTKNCFC